MSYWAACYTEPQAEPIARREIEGINIGTFVPSFAKCSRIHGKVRQRRLPILPGYVFVWLEEGDDRWGKIQHIERASIRVLTNAGEPSRVTPAEMDRLLNAHVMGDLNVTVHRSGNGQFSTAQKPKQKKRRSRPRAVKSTRARRRQAKRARMRGEGHRNLTHIQNQSAA